MLEEEDANEDSIEKQEFRTRNAVDSSARNKFQNNAQKDYVSSSKTYNRPPPPLYESSIPQEKDNIKYHCYKIVNNNDLVEHSDP